MPDSHSLSDHLSPVFESRREPCTHWDSALEVLHADAILPQVWNPSLGPRAAGELCLFRSSAYNLTAGFAFGTLSDWLVKKLSAQDGT